MDPTLQVRLAQLVDRLIEQSAADGVPDSSLQRHLLEMRDALDSLRLSVKYLAFDLDATRRENALLRKQIENQR